MRTISSRIPRRGKRTTLVEEIRLAILIRALAPLPVVVAHRLAAVDSLKAEVDSVVISLQRSCSISSSAAAAAHLVEVGSVRSRVLA